MYVSKGKSWFYQEMKYISTARGSIAKSLWCDGTLQLTSEHVHVHKKIIIEIK